VAAKWNAGIAVLAMLTGIAPAMAMAQSDRGVEVGARTGYAFSAGNLGAPPNGTDQNLGDYVSGQLPLWLDVGYRFNAELYLGGFFQYGFGFVNDDKRVACRNANADCSASDIRLGVMGRYHFGPVWQLSPWAGFGLGYERGRYSFHQSLIGATNTDFSWSGWEFANFQAGADFHIAPRFVLAPFVSISLGEYQSTSSTTVIGSTTTTNDQDLAKKSLHEWILIGVRVAFMP
jgi:opacity protein-like surface antigen